METGEGCDDGKQCANGKTCTLEGDCSSVPGTDKACKPRNGDGCDSQCKLEKQMTGLVREIRIIAHPEKRVNAHENWSTVAKVVFYNKTLKKTVLTTSVDLNDTGWAAFSTDKLDEGVYDVSIKGFSHLTKVLRDIRIDQTTETIDFSQGDSSFLVAGDVHSSKDDFVDGLDIAATVNALYSNDLSADLNHDGFVNALDLSIVVGNIYKYGEKLKI